MQDSQIEKICESCAFCLISNHVHLLAKPLGEDSLFKMMQRGLHFVIPNISRWG